MKRLLLASCLLALFACTKDMTENLAGDGNDKGAVVIGSSVQAAKGYLAVKLDPATAKKVLALRNETRAEVSTRSGIVDFDKVLGEIGATNFRRVFAYDTAWEERYEDTGINCWYEVIFPDEVSMDKAAELFAACPEVQAVEYIRDPMYLRRHNEGVATPLTDDNISLQSASTRAAAAMNDPYLAYQWHYDNPGSDPKQGFNTPAKAGADINLIDAWNLCTGGGDVVVAVIDEPVQSTHPDLEGNIWSNPANPSEHGYNFWNKSTELDWVSVGYNSDYQEWEYADHGTHVAGTIAAMNNNGVGVCGVAGGKNGNGVKIMSCQILGYSNKNVDPLSGIKAFEYALKKGAIVAQNSWGYTNMTDKDWDEVGNTEPSLLRTAIDTFIKYAGSDNPTSPLKGGIVLFSAGNDGHTKKDSKMWPAAYYPLIAVGAMSWDFRPAYYTDYGSWVDITAPGGDAVSAGIGSKYYTNGEILSTILCDDRIDFKDGRKKDKMYGYGFMQGTSMACPHVSGVVALGLAYASQVGKQFTPEEFKALLLASVGGIDQYFVGSKPADGYTISDLGIYKNKMGGGNVDALKLLLAIKGTPAIYVKTAASQTIDFARYLGGSNTKVRISSASASGADLARVGLSSLPNFDGTKLTLNCPKPGAFLVTIKAYAGDTEFSREFAIVSRAGLAENGGWM